MELRGEITLDRQGTEKQSCVVIPAKLGESHGELHYEPLQGPMGLIWWIIPLGFFPHCSLGLLHTTEPLHSPLQDSQLLTCIVAVAQRPLLLSLSVLTLRSQSGFIWHGGTLACRAVQVFTPAVGPGEEWKL